MKKLLPLILSLFLGSYAHAEITLSDLFSDNMILQQLTEAQIWGSTTIKNGEVSVTGSWNGKTVTTKANSSGEWRLKIETPAYGGPYTIKVNDGSQEIEINNVLIGEVWIASGQSNMARTLSGTTSQHIENSTRDIALSKDPQLRIMSIRRNAKLEPQTEVMTKNGWQEASSGVVSGMSATAYHFARMMRECLDVPVGVIVAAIGGTSINCWLDGESVAKYEDVIAHNEFYPFPDSRHSTVLYNGMIHPIAGYSAKGFIWYQGESDITNYASYPNKMVDLVSLWRKKWDNEDMAFYYAQIAPYEYGQYIAPGWESMYVREAQLKALDLIPNSGMAILSDAGDQVSIHPARKDIPGERLAFQALEKSYNFEGLESDGPTLKEVEINGKEMTLTFDNARFGVTTMERGDLRDFEIAGEDGHFVEATAVIERGKVILSTATVKEPKYIRYGFKNWFVGSLFNIEGIPASSFRTDNFPQ